MTKFRPCIDLHDGKVKQIVGSSLSDSGSGLKTNFETDMSAAAFAEMYKRDGVKGGHVIMLGKGNEAAAKAALAAYEGGLQVGGGISAANAKEYLDAGASHVIVTSWIFPNGELDHERLRILTNTIGKSHLVLDLSCKSTARGDSSSWNVAINRWQTLTDVKVSEQTLQYLSGFCDEFLIHAADVEGKQQGMDDELIRFLAEFSPIPITYAGGAKSLDDLEHCKKISKGKVDLTIGSALDIFGGKGVKYDDCIAFNKSQC